MFVELVDHELEQTLVQVVAAEVFVTARFTQNVERVLVPA